MTTFWLATAAAALAAAIGAIAAATAGTTTAGRALCAEGRGRRAAPAASTAAATARATEESHQPAVELGLSSAWSGSLCPLWGISIETVTYTEAGVRGRLPDRSQLLGLCRRHRRLCCQRAFSLHSCSKPRGSWCACAPVCGQRRRTFGLGPGGGGSKAATSASPAPLPASKREAAEAPPWPREPEE